MNNGETESLILSSRHPSWLIPADWATAALEHCQYSVARSHEHHFIKVIAKLRQKRWPDGHRERQQNGSLPSQSTGYSFYDTAPATVAHQVK